MRNLNHANKYLYLYESNRIWLNRLITRKSLHDQISMQENTVHFSGVHILFGWWVRIRSMRSASTKAVARICVDIANPVKPTRARMCEWNFWARCMADRRSNNCLITRQIGPKRICVWEQKVWINNGPEILFGPNDRWSIKSIRP